MTCKKKKMKVTATAMKKRLRTRHRKSILHFEIKCVRPIPVKATKPVSDMPMPSGLIPVGNMVKPPSQAQVDKHVAMKGTFSTYEGMHSGSKPPQMP